MKVNQPQCRNCLHMFYKDNPNEINHCKIEGEYDNHDVNPAVMQKIMKSGLVGVCEYWSARITKKSNPLRIIETEFGVEYELTPSIIEDLVLKNYFRVRDGLKNKNQEFNRDSAWNLLEGLWLGDNNFQRVESCRRLRGMEKEYGIDFYVLSESAKLKRTTW